MSGTLNISRPLTASEMAIWNNAGKKEHVLSLREFAIKQKSGLPLHNLGCLGTYEFCGGVLTYKKISNLVFEDLWQEKGIDFETCFVIECDTTLFDGFSGRVAILTSLDIAYHQWQEALLLIEEPETGKLRFDLVCEQFGHIPNQIFKRSLINGPHLIEKLGVKGVYPIITKYFYRKF